MLTNNSPLHNWNGRSSKIWVCLPSRFGALALMLAWLQTPLNTSAQTSNAGSVVGSVSDQSSQPVAGASTTLTNENTSAIRTAVTREMGLFEFDNVLPGSYTLEVTSQGFKSLKRTTIHLAAGERLSIGDLRLEIGSTSESITVSG